MDFGNRLKELRKQAGLTQQQLANQVGLSKTVISYYELHTRIPSPEVLIKLSTFCRKIHFNPQKNYYILYRNSRAPALSCA